jgi:hypothetical protein
MLTFSIVRAQAAFQRRFHMATKPSRSTRLWGCFRHQCQVIVPSVAGRPAAGKVGAGIVRICADTRCRAKTGSVIRQPALMN